MSYICWSECTFLLQKLTKFQKNAGTHFQKIFMEVAISAMNWEEKKTLILNWGKRVLFEEVSHIMAGLYYDGTVF